MQGRSRTGRDEGPALDAPLEQEQEQEQRMDAIARLAGGVAHNLNNILAVISMCTDEILETIAEADERHACLIDIRHAVERGASLTRDLLSFSRRDLREPRIVNLNELLVAATGMVEQIVGSDVVVRTELAATDAWVHVDASQWTSVFMNLALNARSAMPNGGSLTLSTRSRELAPALRRHDGSKGSYVELEVTDSGTGMSQEIQARIFEPFFTAEGTTSRAGLGLSVVHGVVEDSGGWIEVRSAVDLGTTFNIYLPTAEPAPVASASRPLLTTRESTVLLVEDETSLRRIAARSLERQGYHVLQAESAEAALAILSDITKPLDLLVTDVVLPGMNGRRFASHLLERQPDLAVLYTSGHTDDEALRLGVTRSELAFLQKPYTTKRLVARVEELLASRTSQSPASET